LGFRVLQGWGSGFRAQGVPLGCTVYGAGSRIGGQHHFREYRGTSLTRKHNPLVPYRRPMPRVLGGS